MEVWILYLSITSMWHPLLPNICIHSPSHQTLKKDEFYALLEAADLGVITPLRDGMNTTSMEYVIAQERTNKAPLVLSEFMGISQHMSEALQVNPWDLGVRALYVFADSRLTRLCIQDVAEAMNRGLLMSEASKASRHAALHRFVTTHTSQTWAAVLAKMLLSQINGQTTARRTPYLSKDTIKESYNRAKKRLFLFDYDVYIRLLVLGVLLLTGLR